MVLTGVSAGGSLPTGDPGDLFFDAGRTSAAINNGGDNVIVYDPGNDEYIAATFNGDPLDNPTLGGGGYTGFSSTATQSGAGEDFGFDTDGQSLQRAPDGSSTFVSDTPSPGTTNVCFVKGTAISTPDGPKLVETLRPGDLVTTLDRGAQKVKWLYAKTWSAGDIIKAINLAPVLITQGALGNNQPLRDLRISQLHRILVRGPISQRMYQCAEVLIAAKHLTDLPGVAIECPKDPVTYYHVMLDQHEVLCAEGVPAESLYLGAETLSAIPAEGLREIETLMGLTAEQLKQATRCQARPFAQGKRAKKLIYRHKKNGLPITTPSSQPRPTSQSQATDAAATKTAV
jgi:hypothetical protein